MSRHFPQVGGLWFSPLMVGHLCSCTAMVMVCAGLAPPAPTLLSTLLVVCATPIGLCAALNLFLGGLLCASRLVQWYVFGKLRVAEYAKVLCTCVQVDEYTRVATPSGSQHGTATDGPRSRIPT